MNPLSNAIKYNRADGEVTGSCETVPGRLLRIGVGDTGPGIPATLQDKLFLPFERLARESGEIEGSGIGLTISRQLIESMGGHIGFESEEGRGRLFWVDVPLNGGNGRRPSPSGHPAPC